jgi:formylglycine-generating enzyme
MHRLVAQSCTLCVLLVAGLALSSCGGSNDPGSSDAAGGSSSGGANSGGIAGTSSGGSSGADGGFGNLGPGCSGNGGLGGMPPYCSDGRLQGASQTEKGYCYTSDECTGATPLCGSDPATPYLVTCLACPAGMVSVGDSCVDPTEVTRADYEAWLASAPVDTGQLEECAWNASFVPDASCMAQTAVCQGACDSHPQVCVDWCDAAAYCSAKGKRLCGSYPTGDDDWLKEEDASELLEACNETDTAQYPYGSSYAPGTCNGSEAGAGTTVPVGSKTGCAHSHTAGKIHDLTGNVREWENACGAADYCRLRGGSFLESGESSTCWKVDKNVTRDSAAPDIGFRCCAP